MGTRKETTNTPAPSAPPVPSPPKKTTPAAPADSNFSFNDAATPNLYTLSRHATAPINHCGACGPACPFTTKVTATNCTLSACKVTACSAGTGDCNVTYGDGCEANLVNSD